MNGKQNRNLRKGMGRSAVSSPESSDPSAGSLLYCVDQ